MTDDDKPRTALEIAMARLKQRDAESGVVETPLSEQQKAQIAEARSVHKAKVAQREILHKSALLGVFDPADRERIDAEHRDELRRLNEDFERSVRRVRGGVGID